MEFSDLCRDHSQVKLTPVAHARARQGRICYLSAVSFEGWNADLVLKGGPSSDQPNWRSERVTLTCCTSHTLLA